jgi:RNA recognition motif-containing protein
MVTRLDVGNLPSTATAATLRKSFEQFGDVVDVRIVLGGHAFVTMSSRESGRAAIEAMNGASFDARELTVGEARDQPKAANVAPKPAPALASATATAPSVRLTRTVRDRTFIGSELVHHGNVIVLRMYPSDEGDGKSSWRVEATTPANERARISASASTRRAALEEVRRSWQARTRELDLLPLDWNAISELMDGIRAL